MYVHPLIGFSVSYFMVVFAPFSCQSIPSTAAPLSFFLLFFFRIFTGFLTFFINSLIPSTHAHLETNVNHSLSMCLSFTCLDLSIAKLLSHFSIYVYNFDWLKNLFLSYIANLPTKSYVSLDNKFSV